MVRASYIVAILTCAAIVALALMITERSRRLAGGLLQNTPQEPKTSQKLTFQRTLIGDGESKDGTRVLSEHFKSSDCVPLSKTTTFFNSAERAAKEIGREISRASAVIDRGPVLNDQGLQVGERFVLRLDHKDQPDPPAEVIWNEGPTLVSVTARSLPHVLEFEKSGRLREGRITMGLPNLQSVTFDITRSSDGKTEEGFAYSEKAVRSSDCETITARIEYFPSPARAHEEMQRKLKDSTNIIERGPKVNGAGQPVGERAVAMFRAEPPSEHLEDTIVMWTVNSELHSIKGSFTHVLELEKRNDRYE